jgi:hypothetical protein
MTIGLCPRKLLKNPSNFAFVSIMSLIDNVKEGMQNFTYHDICNDEAGG